MTPEEKQQLDRVEKKLNEFLDIYRKTFLIDKVIFQNPIILKSMTNGISGFKIGLATTDLLSFYGVTPVDQPATVADPSGGATVDSQSRTAIIAIIDRLQELGLIA